MIITIIVIAGIVLLIAALKSDKRNANIANENLKVATENSTASGHNLLLAGILQQLLIKQLGVKKAAAVFFDAVESNPDAGSILQKMYENAGLEYSSSTMFDEKARKIVLRTLTTQLQNMKDQMEDEIDNS